MCARVCVCVCVCSKIHVCVCVCVVCGVGHTRWISQKVCVLSVCVWCRGHKVDKPEGLCVVSVCVCVCVCV